jgi:hypothetical protein
MFYNRSQMPLDPEKVKILEANAERLAAEIPASKQEGFKKDYLEIMIALNEKIDYRLEEFQRDTASVICCVIGKNPSWVLKEANRQASSIRAVCDNVMGKVVETDVFASRALMIEAMADIVKYCGEWMVDTQIKAEARQSEKVS